MQWWGQETKWEAPGHISLDPRSEFLTPDPLGPFLQWSALQVGQGLGGGLCLPWGHCPLKCLSLPQWKQAPGFCFCPLTFGALKLTPCRPQWELQSFAPFFFSLCSSLNNTDLLNNTNVAALRRHSKSVSGLKANFLFPPNIWSSLSNKFVFKNKLALWGIWAQISVFSQCLPKPFQRSCEISLLFLSHSR